MKQSLPRPVLDYMQSFNIGRHYPAFLKLSPAGLVKEFGGDLERFGISSPPLDTPAGDTALYLEGMLPLKTPTIILPGLETTPGVFADIHMFKENHSFTWVVFLDATELETKLRSILQKTNELQLKESQYRKSLAENVPAHVLMHLNIALFQRVEPDRYKVVGELPQWFKDAFTRCDVPTGDQPQPHHCFPFLEYFLHYEAPKIWDAVSEDMLTSDLWIETDPSNREYYLEAAALWLKNKKILMIRRVDEEHGHFHPHIQKGREKSLAYERLKKTERFLKSFIANMSHELRTPMNAIMGISRMFTNYYADNLTEKQKEGLQLIHQSGKRLLDIINSLLDLTKIEAGKMDLLTAPLVLEDLLRGMEKMTQALIKDKNKDISVRLRLTAGLPRRIVADEGKLNQVLVNLLGNAVKFTKKGEIRLSCYVHGEQLYFTVKDTGIGISSEHLTDIFESFVQADGSMTREYGGTGLGLALCKKLVKLMDGNISVHSELNKGSVFTFFIPYEISDEDQGEEQKQATEPPPHQQYTVLVADDEELGRSIAEMVLNNHFRVVFAKSGTEALTRIDAQQPDILLLNIKMPDMNGFQVFDALKARPGKRIPVIAMTALAAEDEKTKILEYGFDGYISRPIDERLLVQTIHRLLNKDK
jgi:signal transduction histidine kinase/CheY-like chemotaxis protein